MQTLVHVRPNIYMEASSSTSQEQSTVPEQAPTISETNSSISVDNTQPSEEGLQLFSL